MRIAHIITRLIIGGAQENTILSCEDLIHDYGDDVLLLLGPTEGAEGSMIEHLQSGNRLGTSIRSPLPDEKPGTIPYILVPTLIRSIRPLEDYLAYRKICKILRDFKPDIVHTHSAKAGVIGRYAARALGVPGVVHGVHGAPFYPYQNPVTRCFYRLCEQRAARKCDAFISVADAMTDLMVKAKVAPRERFTTIYSGMEVDPFLQSEKFREETRAKYGFTPDQIVIGKVARLFYLKGHEFVIQAAQKVIPRCPQVRFLFVGDGILQDRYREEIRAAGLSDYFVFAGLIPPDEIPALFSAMDIVVHTSLREGLARVLPQGLLSGKPVVSYDIDGAREVVLDQKTGFLLPPKEIDGLVNALIQLANDSDLRRRMGEEGRRRFAKRFEHHYMTEQIRALYLELLRKKRGSTNGAKG